MDSRNQQRREAAESDGVHSSQIGIFTPDFAPMREHRPGKGSEQNEGAQNRDEEFRTPEKARHQREEEIEHFFDRKRPQNIPIAGKVAATVLEHIDVESEGGKEGTSEAACVLGDDEMPNLGEVQSAEHD